MQNILRTLALVAGTACLGLGGVLPAPARADTLTIALDYDPADLYGTLQTNNPMFAIIESLYLDSPKTKTIEPNLALGYDKVSDTEVLVHLREGVKFSNGEPMDAAAVVHSIALFADPKTVPAYGIFAAMVDHAEAVDDHTVRLILSRPTPILDLLLAQIMVVPPKYWEEVGAKGFGQKPVGTGPFVLTEWAKDDRMVMDRNPDYWGDYPENIDKLVWRIVPEASSRSAGLRAGEFELAANIPIIDVDAIDQTPGLHVYGENVARVFQLLLDDLDGNTGPVSDRRVRQAINYAIDKQGIIDALYYGKASLLHGQVIQPGQAGYDPEMKDYPFDPAKARALLAEAGFPDGVDIDFRCPSNRYPQGKETCEAIAAMLADVGIRTNMILLESGEFIRQLVSREYVPVGIIGVGVPDDASFGLAIYRSNYRMSYYQNPKLDALIDASGSEMDPAKREQVIRDASHLMFDDATIAYLFGGRSYFGFSERLEGFATNTAQRFFVQEMALKPKQ